MKSSIRFVTLAPLLLGLAACVYGPPPPYAYEPVVAPGPVYVAPAPYYYRGCGPDRHWVRRHRNHRGLWIRAHCALNRVVMSP
jgi:hypothetical protein